MSGQLNHLSNDRTKVGEKILQVIDDWGIKRCGNIHHTKYREQSEEEKQPRRRNKESERAWWTAIRTPLPRLPQSFRNNS